MCLGLELGDSKAWPPLEDSLVSGLVIGVTTRQPWCPPEVVLASSRTGVPRDHVRSGDIFFHLSSEVTDCFFWNFLSVACASSDSVCEGSVW